MTASVTELEISPAERAGPTDRPLRRELHISCYEGAAFGGMVGFGETFLPAFALVAGLGELTAGLVGSLPLLAGGLMQMVSLHAVRLLKSHKRWVVCCAVMQSLTFFALLAAALNQSISSAAVLVAASVYWGAGLATGPTWNTWIGTVVPSYVRPRFFALRTRASQISVFLGFLVGGIALQIADQRGIIFTAYAFLFAGAGLCRLTSAMLLGMQSEPIPLPENMRRIRWGELIKGLRHSRGGQLLAYLVAVQAAVQMAGPFFTPFMFKRLNLSYGQFVSLISCAFLAKIIVLPLWGRVAHRLSAWQLIWIGGVGIVPLSGGWLISQNFWWLVALQIFGGAAWAAYELAFFLLFFESIPDDDRTSMLTFYNLINTVAWVGGTAVGGLLLVTTGGGYQSYLYVFGASSVGRALALLLLIRISPLKISIRDIGLRTLAVRPNTASVDTPVLSSFSHRANSDEQPLDGQPHDNCATELAPGVSEK